MSPKKKAENPAPQETTPRKRYTKIKYTVQQEDFRTTIPSYDYEKLVKENNNLIDKSPNYISKDITKSSTEKQVVKASKSVKKDKTEAKQNVGDIVKSVKQYKEKKKSIFNHLIEFISNVFKR